MRILGLVSLLLLAANLNAAESERVSVTGSFAASHGEFDPAGFARLPPGFSLWDSRHKQNGGAGTLAFGPFHLGDRFALYLAGFPREFGVTFGWEDARTHERLLLAPRQQPMESWTLLRWSVPRNWQGRSVFVYAEDRLGGANDWLGISEPVAAQVRLEPLVRLLGLHLLIFPLLLLPGAAFVSWWARRRPMEAEEALALVLVAGGLVASATFFACHFNAHAGRLLAWVTLLVSLQTWVFLGLWILLRLARLAAATTAWILFYAAFSGFFLLNGTFVWPKLLPVAYLLIVAALLFQAPAGRGWLAGTCAGLAMLGHGGSAFGLIGLGLVSLLRPPPRRWRVWSATVLAGALCLLPWTLYQRFCAPPGNRLLKWHLAGVVDVDARSFPQALHDAYAALTGRQFLENKRGNFTRLFGLDDSGVLADLASAASKIESGQTGAGLRLAAHALRSGCFLNLFQSPGPLLLGAIGLCWLGRRAASSEAEAARHLAGLMVTLVGAITLPWCLLMFTAKSTVNHQGCYLNNACLFVALGLGACQLPRQAQYTLAAVSLAWFGGIWILAPSRTHFTSALLPSADPVWLAFVVGSSLATLSLLAWLGRASSMPAGSSRVPVPGA